jgi:hypothetical protein
MEVEHNRHNYDVARNDIIGINSHVHKGQTYDDGNTLVNPVQTMISPHMDIK